MKKPTNNPMDALKDLIVESGNQTEAAKRLKITPQYLSDLLRGRRDISEVIARSLGFKRSIIFEEIKK